MSQMRDGERLALRTMRGAAVLLCMAAAAWIAFGIVSPPYPWAPMTLAVGFVWGALIALVRGRLPQALWLVLLLSVFIVFWWLTGRGGNAEGMNFPWLLAAAAGLGVGGGLGARGRRQRQAGSSR